jgi:hypothetical protein
MAHQKTLAKIAARAIAIGVIQNQRFRESHSRQFAPSRPSSQRNPLKTGKTGIENGARWRFSEG